jgi:malonyl-CoA O-methyltransferase
VTGYFVPTLLNYGERDLAQRLVAWLVAVQQPEGFFTDPDYKRPYIFDTGQALRGLLKGINLVPEAREAARRAADYLCRQMVDRGRGGFPASYGDFDYVPESIHLYVLPALRQAAEILANPAYREAADHCMEFYIRHEETLNIQSTLTHFLAYELEALIDLGRPELSAPALDQLRAVQAPDGSVRGIGSAKWVCTPGLIQLAICWYKIGDHEPADKATEWVEVRQAKSGGFRGSYGRGAWYFPSTEPAWAVKYYLDANFHRIRTFFHREASTFPEYVANEDGRLQAILSVVRPGDAVLEVGCGKGRFLKAIYERRPNVDCTGVDISAAFLQCVPQPIRAIEGSLEAIPSVDDQFDVVFCVEAIEHSANPTAAVSEMVRVAREGGWIVIIDKQRSQWGRLKCPPWESWPDKEELSSLLRRGCNEVEAVPVSYDGRPANDKLMVSWRGRKRRNA